jgi:hypothetical protein
VCAAVTAVKAQSIAPPLDDTRLTVHTLLREDLFAGFIDDNTTRFERGEKNLAALLDKRPDQRANLLAWRAGTEVYRAVVAHEGGKAAEYDKYMTAAKKDFTEARTLSKGGDGVPPITGGVYAVFADRLPEKDRAAAWQQAYESYSILWNAQKDQLEQLPLHFKGEVLAGMAQSAQRTGRTAESAQFVDRMLALLADTPYEGTARKWKENPSFAASATLTCKNCHSAGRLNAKLAALDGK